MKENELRKYLTDEEFTKVINDANDLEEDLKFFKLYVGRNKKSRFSFDLIPTSVAIGGKLMKKLYNDYYQYCPDKLRIMLTEVTVVNNMMNDLNGECLWTSDAVAEIKHYFHDKHEIKLRDYVSDFIHCSRSCDKVWAKLM